MMAELSGSLEGSRSLAGSTSMAMEAANPRPSPDTAETRVDEQASAKTDPETEHVKLRRATEQINLLEGKLQHVVNENAKLKVKQTEDSRLWQGLDSKLSSTKTLCSELTETVQQPASQTEQAEEEEVLEKNPKSMDEFSCLFHDLSTKLEDAEQKKISGRKEMLQIKQGKEEMEQSCEERLYLYDTTIKEKGSLIKQLEGSIDKNKSHLICLDSRLQCMEQQLKLNDDVCINLKGNLASSESEKNSLELMNKEQILLEIEKLREDNKDLKELLSSFMVKVTELYKDHASVSSHVCRLISTFERFYEMAQEEKMLMDRCAKDKFERLQRQYEDLTPENNALRNEIEELMLKLMELQITQEIVMIQECQVAKDKIRRLESEAEVSASNINQLEEIASEVQGRIQKLLKDSTLAENHKQELLKKISDLESDTQELLGQVQAIMKEKSSNAESLQGEITKRDQQVNTLENQINQLHSVLDEKEQLYRCSLQREKTLEDQRLQVEASLSAAECQLSKAKEQYDLMLEGAKIQLSKHLEELSLKNDQEINEIRKKYELEKIEITSAEKEKAEKLIREIENKCNEKISQNKHDFERDLICLKKEHGTMVARTQQDNEHKESALWAYHKEELQRIQSLAETELRERLSLLRKEHELEIKSLRMNHEEACQRMQEVLELQKSKGGGEIWNKRQIIYVLVLTTTANVVFLLQPLLPVAYGRWIIFLIAAIWGIGSIGLSFELYGTSRCEQQFSRYIGGIVYTLFSVLVIYVFYLLAMGIGDTSSATSPPSSPPLLKEAVADISNDIWWTFSYHNWLDGVDRKYMVLSHGMSGKWR